MPEQPKFYKNNCLQCGDPLRAIGNRRSNGKYRKSPDWAGRKTHVKCYESWLQGQRFKELRKQQTAEAETQDD